MSLILTVVLLLIAAAAGVRKFRTASPSHTLRIVERLVDRIPPAAPVKAIYRWSASEIEQQWSRAGGEGELVFKSPELVFPGGDDLESIAITLEPSLETKLEPDSAPDDRVLLLWNDAPTFSRSDLIRNRRELRPSTQRVRVVLRAEDIRAGGHKPVRYLFLHLARGAALAQRVEAVEVFTQSGQLTGGEAGRLRFVSDGEIRESLYTRPRGVIEIRVDIPREAELAVEVRALDASSSARVRITRRADGGLTEVHAGEVAGRGWREVRVPLAARPGSRLRFEHSGGSGTVVWGNPAILAPDRESRQRPNVILYVVDALRADRLGLYGAHPSPSPFLDTLASASLVVERAYASASWTKPSVGSLLTSLHPQTHSLGARLYTDPLPDSVRTLQDRLGERGYLTAQFSGNPLSASLSNLDQGFDEALGPDAFTGGADRKVTADQVNAKVLPWLRAHWGQRFFLYIQPLDPHGPLDQGQAGDPYDAAIAATDSQLRRLYDRLVGLGLDRETLLIVTSDHGEAFGEHGRTGHGQSLYEEEIRVPLVFHWPRRLSASRITRPVSLIDVVPTILDLCKVPYDPREFQGRSRLVAGAFRESPDPVFASSFVYPEDAEVQDSTRVQATMILEFPWKLILTSERGREEPRVELFDLGADPKERRNLTAAEPARVEAMRTRLRRFLADQDEARLRFVAAHGGPGALDQRDAERGQGGPFDAAQGRPVIGRDVLERLRSLGYVR